MPASKDDDETRIRRLTDAVEAFLEHDASGTSDRKEFLADHGELRDLLEPMLDDAPAEDAADRDGAIDYLGDYRIIREIGRGGMGVVYEAIQSSLDRRVALKVLLANVTLSPRQVERFRGEAMAIAKLQHPAIVPVFDVGEHDGAHFFAMEFVDGANLAHLLQDARRRTFGVLEGATATAEIVEIVATIGEALHSAHSCGILHRDVKPHNILIGKGGAIRLVDFGLARDAEGGDLSHTGDFAGTPFYASPEQVIGDKQNMDGRSDVFSLGVVLYEALTQRRPFRGESTQAILDQIRTSTPTALRRENPKIARDLEIICHKAIEKDPRDRYASAAAFAADLRRFQRFEPITAQPPGTVTRIAKFVRRKKLATAASLLGLAVLIGTPVAIYWNAAELEARDGIHAAQSKEILGEAMQILQDSELQQRPKSGHLYLEKLERVSNLYDSVTTNGPFDVELLRDSTRVMNDLANTYHRLGHADEALLAHGRSLATIASVVKRRPDQPRYRYDHAAALTSRGKLLTVLGRREEAHADLTAAIEILETTEVAKGDSESHGLALHVSAATHGALARLAETGAGGVQQALTHLNKSVECWDELAQLLAVLPEGSNTRLDALRATAERLHAESRRTRGGLLIRAHRGGDAIEDLVAAAATQEKLLEEQPGNASLRFGLSETRSALSHAYLSQGKANLAKKLLEQCIELQQGLAKDWPESWTYRWNLANGQLQLVDLLRKRAETKERAWELVNEALAGADSLREEFPTFPRNHRIFATITHVRAWMLEGRGVEAEEIIAAHQHAITLLRQAAEQPMNRSRVLRHLGTALSRLALWQIRTGEPSVAAKSIAAAIAAEQAAYGASRSRTHLRKLAYFRRTQHEILYHARDYANAARVAIGEIDSKITPANLLFFAAQTVAQCIPHANDPETYTNHALSGIERAIEKGFPKAKLSENPKFSRLRDHPRFRNLINAK